MASLTRELTVRIERRGNAATALGIERCRPAC
jgi:hypothetical protein